MEYTQRIDGHQAQFRRFLVEFPAAPHGTFTRRVRFPKRRGAGQLGVGGSEGHRDADRSGRKGPLGRPACHSDCLLGGPIVSPAP
ncbi:hypothetical protein [Streptomyces mexicanus]|uniref:hypothetical protein n=1 Tax=Streptomyces mexicanus TaxID=178566 RepID=UPI00367CB75E